ncbi:MAG: hypothetical protein J6D52_00990, partial [Clostridia bacterium]|nr:hypothetical protein [Clostridia bacterium]
KRNAAYCHSKHIKTPKIEIICGIDMKEHKKKPVAPISVTIIMVLYYVVCFGFSGGFIHSKSEGDFPSLYF